MPDDLHDLYDVAAEFGVALRTGPCAYCGRNPSAGYAGRWTNEAGEQWFCHGDDDERPTCYEAFGGQPIWMPRLAQATKRPLDPAAFDGHSHDAD